MKQYSNILAIDPSGNFEEGKGTTGLCLFGADENAILKLRDLSAVNFKIKEDYWSEHLRVIELAKRDFPNLIIVMEDFTLDPKRAMQQSHSKMETSKLIGIIQLHCSTHNIPYTMQRASEVKSRWANNILEYKGYIVRGKSAYKLPKTNQIMSRHCRDAIRHAVHYNTFKNKEVK